MKNLYGAQKEERLPTIVSGIGGTKLLGVSPLPNKSSELAVDMIAQSTVGLLEDWNCSASIVGMVSDTTASNTGTQFAC